MSAVSGITAADIAAAVIPVRRLRARYDIDDVDRFLDECQATVQAWEGGRATGLSASDVTSRTFGSVGGFTPGYDADVVDDLLDRIVVRLRELAG